MVAGSNPVIPTGRKAKRQPFKPSQRARQDYQQQKEVNQMGFDTEKYTVNPFIKGDDLEEGERLVLTITEAEEVNFPSGDTVPCLSFKESDQKLTLNKTRIRKIVDMLGPDTDDWIGQKIALYPVDVQYNGKTMLGVAVTRPPSKKKVVAGDVEFAPAKKGVADEDEDLFE